MAVSSRLGPRERQRVAQYATELLSDSSVAFVEPDRALLRSAIDLYRRRPDKRYSLTDCISMLICREIEITDVLSSDKDFEQEGFTRLLKRTGRRRR
jgi:predicted nucleic acid-binding protein